MKTKKSQAGIEIIIIIKKMIFRPAQTFNKVFRSSIICETVQVHTSVIYLFIFFLIAVSLYRLHLILASKIRFVVVINSECLVSGNPLSQTYGGEEQERFVH